MSRVLIVGASVAGPSLAFWLHRYGFEVTVLEKAPSLRPGGQAVDFKGEVHRRVLREMGILDLVRARDVRDPDGIIVNASGKRIGVIPGAFGAGEINIPRGDLAEILFDVTRDDVDYRFGDSIVSLHDGPSGVDVEFASGATGRFDLVVGADGMHSTVRRLAFGPESDYVAHLGHYYVLADLPEAGGDGEDLVYSEPGRTVMLGGSKAPTFIVFASPLLPSARDDVDEQKRQVAAALAGGGWRIPEIVGRFPEATDFYLDSISRATVDRYSKGRVVLLGDSAWGNALGGFGTGLAMVGAYVLAGELARATAEGRTDHEAAFAEFQRKFEKYASVSRSVNAGRFLAPLTRGGIRVRNAVFRVLSIAAPLVRLLDRPAAGIELDDYAGLVPVR